MPLFHFSLITSHSALMTIITVLVIALPAACLGFATCALILNRRTHNTARRYRHLPRL